MYFFLRNLTDINSFVFAATVFVVSVVVLRAILLFCWSAHKNELCLLEFTDVILPPQAFQS